MNYRAVNEDMILFNGFDTKYNENYNIYLGAFPYKLYDSDFKFILDGAFEHMDLWVETLKWNPTSSNANIITDFAKGSPLYITDISGDEHVLTKEKLVIGIKLVLSLYGGLLLYGRNELQTYRFTSGLCDLIVQFSLYRTYKYID